MIEVQPGQVGDLLLNMMEESGEITQAASKWLRFGPDSFHPDDPQRIPNKVLLAREIGNLLALVTLFTSNELLCDHEITVGINEKLRKLKKYNMIDDDRSNSNIQMS